MNRNTLSAGVLIAVLILAGCQDKQSVSGGASDSVAKVNGEVITTAELDHELTKLGKLDPQQAQSAANQLLHSMVDQQLLVQKAIADKLDQDPKVAQTLTAARRQILAQAYAEKLGAGQAQPSDAEIADYYGKNPWLFAERRIYRLREISVQTTAANLESTKTRLAQGKNLNEFLQWLKTESIPARVSQAAKAAEQLPMEMLQRLYQLKAGQIISMQSGNQLNILVLVGSEAQPVSLEQAKPMMARYLFNKKKRGAAEEQLNLLRAKAKVEYLGQYSEAGKATAAPAPTK